MSSVSDVLAEAKAVLKTDMHNLGIGATGAIDRVTPPESLLREQAYKALYDARPVDWHPIDWGNLHMVHTLFDVAIAIAKEGER